eukprot:1180755-Prorocentrum_minimum.AAC.10
MVESSRRRRARQCTANGGWAGEYLRTRIRLIKDLKNRQEQMANEFSEMLKETLDKMAECLDNTDDKPAAFLGEQEEEEDE